MSGKEIHKRLEILLKEKGKNFRELAEYLKLVPQGLTSRWQGAEVKHSHLEEYATFLGITINELLGEYANEPAPAHTITDNRHIIELYQQNTDLHKLLAERNNTIIELLKQAK